MKTIYGVLIFFILLVVIGMSSCQYDYIVEPVIPPPNLTDTISFADKIEPIFNDNATCTSCHNTGGQTPDLTTGNAYNSILNFGLVNTSDPESGKIYWIPNLNNDSEHTWKKYTDIQAQLVLQWIKQGALDN